MVQIHVERTIAAAPEQVFGWLADPANFTADPSRVLLYQVPAAGQKLPLTPKLTFTPFPDFTGGVHVG